MAILSKTVYDLKTKVVECQVVMQTGPQSVVMPIWLQESDLIANFGENWTTDDCLVLCEQMLDKDIVKP